MKTFRCYTESVHSLEMGLSVGYRIPDAGYRIQDTGYRIQDFKKKLQDMGFRIQDTRDISSN